MKQNNFRLSPSRILSGVSLAFILTIFILGFFPGAFDKEKDSGHLSAYNGRQLSFHGRICEEADVDYKSRRLTVCVSGAAQGRVLVTTDLYPAYDYGNFIEISGELQAPPMIEGFDYESYLARYDIYSVMYYPKIRLAAGTLSWSQMIYGRLIAAKQFLKSIIDSNLPEPEAGLADALLLGYRRTLAREDLDVFARVGLSHMIAISGSHITILSAMAISFLLALGFHRRQALKIIFIFLFIYPLITGLSASAVRSALMGGLAFLAFYHGRSSSLVRALIFAAALMLAFNPRLLRADIGFQLSFLALLGIIYVYPLGERLTQRFLEPKKLPLGFKKALKNILDTINLTLVSQLVILPVALINFKQFSLIAPLANVLVLWTFAPLLAALIIALLAAALVPSLGIIFFAPAYFLLKFIFSLAELLARSPWAAMAVGGFNWFHGAWYYLLGTIALITARRYFFKQKKTL